LNPLCHPASDGKAGAMAECLLLKRTAAHLPPERRPQMNQDIMNGKWRQFSGKMREKWGKLTDDDLDVINGRRDQFLGKLQERYGVTRDEAEKQLKDFESSYKGTYQETEKTRSGGAR
jgi:uncharacterized protein YjbJ (UPF0337 family)